MTRDQSRKKLLHEDEIDDPLVYLRDAIGHAEGFEQGVLNQAHNRILKHRKRGSRIWICPACQILVRGTDRPDLCPECGEWGRELAQMEVRDV